MKFKIVYTILLVFGAVQFSLVYSMETIYAVNCGGPVFIDSNGIQYAKDFAEYHSPHYKGITQSSNIVFNGVSQDDNMLYQTSRRHYGVYPTFYYDLPLMGDGWYALVLHLSNKGHENYYTDLKSSVTFNGQHKLLMTHVCVIHDVCNEIFYFSICQGVLKLDTTSSLVKMGQKVRVKFDADNFHVKHINAIWLVKGSAGERQSVAGTNSTIFFDPEQEMICDIEYTTDFESSSHLNADLMKLMQQIVADQKRISKFLHDRELFPGEF